MIEIFGISLTVEYVMQLVVTAFLAALFLQSGLDKLFDWRGNIQYLTEHFAKSFLSPFVPPMLTVITVLGSWNRMRLRINCAADLPID